MGNDAGYEKLFSYLKPPEPPADLFARILNKIQRERRVALLRRRIAIFAVGVLSSLIAFVPALKMLEKGVSSSGFAYFLSLIFSDLQVITTYWQSFVMSLLETLPVSSLAAFLTVIFVFLASIRFLIRDARTFVSYSNIKLVNA